MTKPTIVLRNRDGQWTNEHGIEPVLFSQLTSDNYPHHDDDPYTWSATELVDPTNLTVLTRRHRAERVIDASAMVHSHIGRALHYYDHVHAVKHTPVFSEDRLDVSILVDGDNYTITGQADKYEPWWYFRGEPAPTDADDDEWAVVDNKFTSLAGWKREDFAKWDQQLNVYAWLARNALGWKILGARVQGFLDGWSALQAQRDPQMPQTKAPTYTVPLWDDDAVNRWITSRILELREQLPRADRDLVPCSPAERWEKPTTWAVKKKGNKHAMRNGAGYLDRAEAEAFAASQSVPTEIEFRPGERARCERFCSVRPWCSLYRVKGGLK